MPIKRVFLPLASIIFFLGFCNNAFAHKVNLFCYFEDGYLVGEGYYSGGRPAQNAGIGIYSLKDNTPVANTQTDANGKFKVQLDYPDSVKVVMNAGQGHRCEFIVEQESNVAVENIDLPKDRQIQKSEIDELIEQKIKPLEARIMELEKQQSGPKAISIAGGVGFIIGIFSCIYFIKRKHAL